MGRRWIVPVAVVSLAAWGCGSGHHATSDAPASATQATPHTGQGAASPTALSKGAFQGRANALCTTYKAKTDRLAKPTNIASVASYAQGGRQVQQAEAAALGKLRGQVPKAYATNFDAALKLLGDSIAILDRLTTAAKASNTTRVTQIATSGQSVAERLSTAMSSIGLIACGGE